MKQQSGYTPTKEIEACYATAVTETAKVRSYVKNLHTNMRSVNTELGLIVNTLQENMRILRLVPVGSADNSVGSGLRSKNANVIAPAVGLVAAATTERRRWRRAEARPS